MDSAANLAPQANPNAAAAAAAVLAGTNAMVPGLGHAGLGGEVDREDVEQQEEGELGDDDRLEALAAQLGEYEAHIEVLREAFVALEKGDRPGTRPGHAGYYAKPIKFWGDGHKESRGLTAKQWLGVTKHQLTTGPDAVPTNDLVQAASGYLLGDAWANWAIKLAKLESSGLEVDWAAFEQAVLSANAAADPESEARIFMRTARPRAGQPFQKFANEFKQMSALVPGMDERSRVDLLVDAMPPDLKDRAGLNPQNKGLWDTVDNCIEYAVRTDQLMHPPTKAGAGVSGNGGSGGSKSGGGKSGGGGSGAGNGGARAGAPSKPYFGDGGRGVKRKHSSEDNSVPSLAKRYNVSVEVATRRIKDGQCVKCGSKEHKAFHKRC